MCVNYVILLEINLKYSELPLSVRHKTSSSRSTKVYAFLCIKEHFHSAHLFHLWLHESITWFQKYL